MSFFLTEGTQSRPETQRQINPDDYQPLRLGLKRAQQQIVIEYLVPSTSKKFRHYISLPSYPVDVSQSKAQQEVELEVFESIFKRHSLYLKQSSIQNYQIQSLISELMQFQKGQVKNLAKSTSEKSVKAVMKKVEAPAAEVKQEPVQFQKKLGKQKENESENLKQGKGTAVSKQQQQQPEKKQASGDFGSMGQFPPPVKQNLTSLSSLPPPISAKPQVKGGWDDDGWGDDWNLDDADKEEKKQAQVDYDTFDMNKLSDMELKKEKMKMDEKYVQNYVGPSDPGFVYDVRKDFSGSKKVDTSWDDDDYEDDFE